MQQAARKHVRKTNGAGVAYPVAMVEREVEMAELDRLGPIARKAICDAPLSFLASSITSQVDDANQRLREAGKPELDMRRPEIDVALAHSIRDNCLKAMLNDRSPDDAMAGLRPLTPKRVRRAY